MEAELKSNLPQRGNRGTCRFGHLFLRLFGWRIAGQLPDIPKMVIIVAPHTSNWDFVIGIMTVFALDLKAHWIGKHTIFIPPFKSLMEWLGGIPVNRSLPNDLIQTTTERFSREEKFIIGIAPEGTRRKVTNWKKGYYRIASEAKVPIVCAYLDYRTKTIGFGQALTPTGDYNADFVCIRQFFSTATGKFPENH